MAKGIYRVDGRFSGVSHQFKLINFVDFFFCSFFCPCCLCVCWSLGLSCAVLCSVRLSCSYMSGVGVTVTVQGGLEKAG